MWRLYIPLHLIFIHGESHQTKPTLPTYHFWERTTYSCVEAKIFHSYHMNLDLYLSPSCFPLKPSFHQIQILWERVECWGDYHLNHKSKEFIINTPSITFWRVVSPRLVRCCLGASIVMWSWTKKFVRERRFPTSWWSTRVREVLHGRWPWWDRQGCFFVHPSWVEPSVDSRNRYPSWVEVSINVDVR